MLSQKIKITFIRYAQSQKIRITFIRYAQSQKIRITFIRYAQSQKIRITFIRYAQSQKIGKPNNLNLFGRNLVSENMTAFILGKCVKITE
jgi:hypothetical protein